MKNIWPKLQKNYPFSKLTTLNIGGPAKYLYIATTKQDLLNILDFAYQNNLKYLVIGGGSNLLVSDKGFNGLVIKNEVSGISLVRRRLARLGTTLTVLTVQGGNLLQNLVDYTIKHGLSGMQRLTDIPGTVGGAIYGNAGAYNQTISDYLIEVECWTENKIVILTKAQCNFEYRDSGFKKNGCIILEVKFKLPQGNPVELKKEAKETLTKRLQKYQPGIKCPGSFFKNLFTEEIPEETIKILPERKDTYGKTPAYIFLEQLGAKGDRLGNIQIAPYHANLFINLGGGTASDFWQLANKWYKRVEEKYNIKLEPEVQLINLPPLGVPVSDF